MKYKSIQNSIYVVTELGTIINSSTQRELKLDNNQRYSRIKLYLNGKKVNFLVHRLVAEAFIPNPDNKPYINHIDGNIYNNHVSNLEWCTQAENVQHAVRTGLKVTSVKARQTAKVTCANNNKLKKVIKDENTILDIRNRLSNNELIKDIAKLYNVSTYTIARIKYKKAPYDN